MYAIATSVQKMYLDLNEDLATRVVNKLAEATK
jgi:hypothetical protein